MRQNRGVISRDPKIRPLPIQTGQTFTPRSLYHSELKKQVGCSLHTKIGFRVAEKFENPRSPTSRQHSLPENLENPRSPKSQHRGLLEVLENSGSPTSRQHSLLENLENPRSPKSQHRGLLEVLENPGSSKSQ